MTAVDRDQLRHDLSDALSAIHRDQDVVGRDALAGSLGARTDLCVSRAAAAGRPDIDAADLQRAHLEPGAGARQARARDAVTLYARVRAPIRRRRATRRRSRRAANCATARRAACTTRPTMSAMSTVASATATVATYVAEARAWFSGRAYRRHRASDKSVVVQDLSSRATLALSTGLPSIGT